MTEYFTENDFLDYAVDYLNDRNYGRKKWIPEDEKKWNYLLKIADKSYKNKRVFYCDIRKLGLSREWYRWRRTILN